MSSPIKIFKFRLFLLVVSLSLLIYVLKNYLVPEWVHQDIWIIYIFFSVFTLVSGLFVLYLLKLSEENTTNILLGTSVLRLLVSAGFFAIMMFLGIGDQTLFVINFFIVYLFYLLFDILTLITNLRPNLK